MPPRKHVKCTSDPNFRYCLWFADGTKTQSSNKNGKKADSGSRSSSSFFTWFIVLALLGVWTSVAVVYFDLVDYQGVLGECTVQHTRTDGFLNVVYSIVCIPSLLSPFDCKLISVKMITYIK